MLQSAEAFIETLMTKYKLFTSRAFDKLIKERYIMQNARKQRAADEYVQVILRHDKICSIIGDAAVTFAWKNLNNELRHFVRRSNEIIIADDLVLQIEEAIDYYASPRNREKNILFRLNNTEVVYQRDYKIAERHLLLSKTQFYSQSAFQQQFGRQKRIQSSFNCDYSNQQSDVSFNRDSSNQQFGNSAPLRQYSQYSQYSAAPANQKFLTNQVNIQNVYFAFNNPENDWESSQEKFASSTDTKYSTADVHFDETMITFHAHQTDEAFNDTNSIHHDLSSYSCNICAVSYFEDYTGLDNYMFDVHQIDIRSNTSKEHKRYVNWMEHAALNVYEIKTSSNGYVIFKGKL